MASLDSKRSELIDFLKLFREFKDFERPSDNAKNLKIKLLIRPINFTINTLILTKKNMIVKT